MQGLGFFPEHEGKVEFPFSPHGINYTVIQMHHPLGFATPLPRELTDQGSPLKLG